MIFFQVTEWTKEKVQDWFEKNSMFSNFKNHFEEFDGNALSQLTEAQIQSGIGDNLKASALYNAIAQLKGPKGNFLFFLTHYTCFCFLSYGYETRE